MPNYKVRVEFVNDSDLDGNKFHAAEFYLESKGIMTAGTAVMDILDTGKTKFVLILVKKIIEIESRPEPEHKDIVHTCGYFMSVVPPFSYECRSDHLTFREKTGIKNVVH